MIDYIKLYPGYRFTDPQTDDDITINTHSFDYYVCSITDGYTADDGYYVETGNHEERFTDGEMRKKLKARHIIWSDRVE